MEYLTYFIAAAKGASKIAAVVFGSYLVVGVALSAWAWSRDRSGNSGTHGHMDDNRRIDGPDGS